MVLGLCLCPGQITRTSRLYWRHIILAKSSAILLSMCSGAMKNPQAVSRTPYPHQSLIPAIIPIVTSASSPGPDGWESDFTEGLLIDYRAYNAKNSTPLFEFGFGLSYTSFDLDGLPC